MKRLVGSFLLYVVAATSTYAENDPAELARLASEQLEQAQIALEEAERAGDRVAALSQAIRAYETGLEALREGLRRASLREAAIKREFDAESEKVSEFLGVLLTIQSSAGPLVLLHPAGPLGTARSGMIVSDVTPAIQKEALQLRSKLEEVALLRALQESAADSLKQGLIEVQTARTELSQAMSNRTDLPIRFVSDPERLSGLISSSETLDGFASGLAGMDTGPTPDDPVRTLSSAKGTLPLPVSGTLLRRYNEEDSAGIKRPGIVVATQPLALVTNPWPATVRYLGPLLDYGNVMILEPESDTLLVLAGLDQVYGEVGQVVPQGTALGYMGGAATDPDTFLLNSENGSGSEQTETLYMELRQSGEPVDPAQWFAETKEKTE